MAQGHRLVGLGEGFHRSCFRSGFPPQREQHTPGQRFGLIGTCFVLRRNALALWGLKAGCCLKAKCNCEVYSRKTQRDSFHWGTFFPSVEEGTLCSRGPETVTRATSCVVWGARKEKAHSVYKPRCVVTDGSFYPDGAGRGQLSQPGGLYGCPGPPRGTDCWLAMTAFEVSLSSLLNKE